MRTLHLYAILITAICSTLIHAESDTRPSVWAWEVNSQNRKIYLLGEIHYFVFHENSVPKISYNLGEKILDKSSEIWIEEQQSLPKSDNGQRNLSYQVSSTTWNLIKTGFRNAINSMRNLETQERDELYKTYITRLDWQDPLAASQSLTIFANANITRSKPNYVYIPGLKYFILEKNNNLFNQKIKKLETTQAGYEAWWNNCNSKEKAETIINNALAKQDKKYDFSINQNLIYQSIFFKTDENINSFVNATMSNEIEKIYMDCVGIPRSKLWMPSIVEKLSTTGAPITFLVGIGHIGGENGLLSLLKKHGFTDIKRIYSVD